jgi:[protein-PII] uridylyltransferase
MPSGEGLQIMVYLRDRAGLFARIMNVFARLNFSVLDARVHTSRTGYALDTFTVVNLARRTLPIATLPSFSNHALLETLETEAPLSAPPLGKPTRQQRHFPITPVIEITPDEQAQRFVLEIVAADRTGLLAASQQCFPRAAFRFRRRASIRWARVPRTYLLFRR